ncbi:hypothetical protein EV361DRAFT_118048 [Lentinula raphanica]|nr:hypothetical protein EV361DRAFT_118048 [Lentinula raphanica]
MTPRQKGWMDSSLKLAHFIQGLLLLEFPCSTTSLNHLRTLSIQTDSVVHRISQTKSDLIMENLVSILDDQLPCEHLSLVYFTPNSLKCSYPRIGSKLDRVDEFRSDRDVGSSLSSSTSLSLSQFIKGPHTNPNDTHSKPFPTPSSP